MGRRGNGEGTITRRRDGRWEARYMAHTAKGPKRKVLYGKTRAEVAEKLTKAMADRDGGVVFDSENQTVGEYLNRWLRDSVRGSVKPITFESYERLVRVHIATALGRVKLKNLTPAHLQGFYRDRLDAGLSPRTVQYLHVLLHRSLKQALRWNMLPRNVAEAVDPPKVFKEEIRPLSSAQARTLLEAAREDRLEALYVLAIHCGLRQGELLALRWDDVDLVVGTLRVNRSLTVTKDGPTFTTPKTAKSRRTVQLTVGAVEALKRHSERQAQEMVKVDALYRDQGLVFASQIGTPMNRQNLNSRSFKPLLERTGLPNIRFHDLRHTCATLLLGQGVHPKFVQELLGHATIAITLDTYSHVLPGMGHQVSQAMQSVLD